MMANKQQKVSGKCSRGVHTSETHLPAPSSTITESDHEMSQSANDGDQSLVSNDADPLPRHEPDSDTDDDLYRMKISSRRGRKEHPSRVEFQLTKASVGRQKRIHQPCKCHWQAERFVKVPSHNEVRPELVNSCLSTDNFSQNAQPKRSRMRNMFSWWPKYDEEELLDRADIYHFDHGTPAFYQTTDCPPHLVSDILAQRTTFHATKFWAEFFGSINIAVTFFVAFLIQFYRFVLYSILRAIIVGLLQTTSDYLLKPLLAVAFNGFLQPQLIFVRNVFQSIGSMLEPVTKLIDSVMRPFTDCVRAFRLVEVKCLNKEAPSRYQNFQGQGAV